MFFQILTGTELKTVSTGQLIAVGQQTSATSVTKRRLLTAATQTAPFPFLLVDIKNSETLKSTQFLLIDEISMVSIQMMFRIHTSFQFVHENSLYGN